MAQYNVRGYYLDENGRKGEFNFQHHHTDRKQIADVVRMRYPAAKVQINEVNPVAPAWTNNTPAAPTTGTNYNNTQTTQTATTTTTTNNNGAAGAEGGAMALVALTGVIGVAAVTVIAVVHGAPFIGAGLMGWGATKATKGQGTNWKRFAAIAATGTIGFWAGDTMKTNVIEWWAAAEAQNDAEQVAPAPAPAAEAPVFVAPAPVAAPAAPVQRTAAPAVLPVFEAPAAAPAATPAAEAMPWETDEDLTGNAAFIFEG